MVTVMVMNDLLPKPLFNVNRPSLSEIELSMVKAMCVVKGQGQIWPWKFKVKVMFKPISHIWSLEFNRYICFSFHGNQTTLGWDIANSIFDLETQFEKSCWKVIMWTRICGRRRRKNRYKNIKSHPVYRGDLIIWWTYSRYANAHQFHKILCKLDESTAGRQLKSPRSLSGRSLHLTLVTKWSRSHMTLKIQISRSWPRSNPLSNLRPRVQIDMFAFRLVAIGPLLVEI